MSFQVWWAYPDTFQDMYQSLGGMHALMSFVGAIGTLMDESGLSDILSDVFGGVLKMLNRKFSPKYQGFTIVNGGDFEETKC